ncbi:hypothetical protein U1Q18_002390, partial [Sarracenia purpurea var. burkii]
ARGDCFLPAYSLFLLWRCYCVHRGFLPSSIANRFSMDEVVRALEGLAVEVDDGFVQIRVIEWHRRLI